MRLHSFQISVAVSWLPYIFVIDLADPPYSLFDEDLAYYKQNFKAYLPNLTSDAASDLVLFLPVSYHLNPANYPEFVKQDMCKHTKLTWSGTLPSTKFCGFSGRKCYSDPHCKLRCAADIEQAFGKPAQEPLRSNLRISTYFTWYSKKANQPVFSGYWTRPIRKSGGWNPCESQPELCDLTCKDAGGPLSGTNGCEGERACGTFATCNLGSDMIAQRWNDLRPTGADTQESCESQGYYWSKKDGCGYQSMKTDCKTGRCYDRGHVVPSGAISQFYGRSGQTFSMCNIAAQTSLLNQCQWMFLEQAVQCAGSFYKILTLSGSIGPFTPSERMSEVLKPAFQWKMLLIPSSEVASSAAPRDTCFLWILDNSHNPPLAEYVSSSYRGLSGLAEIEADLGFQFPDTIRNCHFPSTCELFATDILDDEKIKICGFVPYDLDQFPPDANAHEIYKKAGPYTVLEICKGATNTPHIPCPKYNITGRKGAEPTDRKGAEPTDAGKPETKLWLLVGITLCCLMVGLLALFALRYRRRLARESHPSKGDHQTELGSLFVK